MIVTKVDPIKILRDAFLSKNYPIQKDEYLIFGKHTKLHLSTPTGWEP